MRGNELIQAETSSLMFSFDIMEKESRLGWLGKEIFCSCYRQTSLQTHRPDSLKKSIDDDDDNDDDDD